MAKNAKNKYPADKTGTKYSEFRNTKRVAPGKARTERDIKQTNPGGNSQTASQTVGKTG